MIWVLMGALALWLWTLRGLGGRDMSRWDQPPPPLSLSAPSAEHAAVVQLLDGLLGEATRLQGAARLQSLRSAMDSLGGDRALECRVVPVQEGSLRGEWVLPPRAAPGYRLLYLHGGAWMAGSPRSHRSITDRLARLTGAAVFALDYRLMPEHPRRAGMEDSRLAWEWLLENGPDGPGQATHLLVAGDSAGGSLTLALLAWIRDQGLRQADAALAFSPSTDLTLSSPSLRRNAATDPLLGPLFRPLLRIPRALLLWGTWWLHRQRPCDPQMSPLHGCLAALPPVLIQVSEQEMLLDDARRYTARAQAAGSPVELQSWPQLVHVWQIFTPELPEAEEAWLNVAEFLAAAGVPIHEEASA